VFAHFFRLPFPVFAFTGGLIHFAGECCSEDNFTMLQGAVETGAAAGRAVHRLLAAAEANEVESTAGSVAAAAAVPQSEQRARRMREQRTRRDQRTRRMLAQDEARESDARVCIAKAAREAPAGALRALLNDKAQDAVHECTPSRVQSWCTELLADCEIEAPRFRARAAEGADDDFGHHEVRELRTASASTVDAASAAPHASADAASSALPSAPPAAPPSEPPSAPPSAPPSSNNSSKFRGVYPSSNVRTGWLQGKWQAWTHHNNVRVDLGLFNDEHAAARAYDKAAIRLRGASAVLNFPEEEYALICGTQSFLERSPGN
jgi:hypothetical protein